MLVAVGSLNPVKINAVKEAFQNVFPDISWTVEGVSVPSGIPDQPMNDKQSIRGARNRAKRAMKALKADYGVGLEGGLHKIGKQWFDSGWMVIIDKQRNEGVGSTIRMKTPPIMMHHVHAGMELGHVDDLMFKKNNSKQANGHFGLMTNDHITRTSAYADGLISALVAFIHPHLFD